MSYLTKKVARLDRWAYLAGIIEADGHIAIANSRNLEMPTITIAGHKNQALHFYWLATSIGMPFSLNLSTDSNSLKLVWSSPHSVKYIQRRLSSFMAYHNNMCGDNQLFIKLNNFVIKSPKLYPYAKYLQRVHVYHSKKIQDNDPYIKNPILLHIISILVGFIDGDGETHIQIGAKHLNSISKNNISAFVRVSQKSIESLNAISYLFSKLDSSVFSRVAIYKTTSGGRCIHLTERQSAYFAKLAGPQNFQNPWTSLGTELTMVIHNFKQHYNFSALGRYVKNKAPQSAELSYWAKQRMYLIIVLQLIRLFIRSPQSLGIPRLKDRLDQVAQFLMQHKTKYKLNRSETPKINLTTNKQLLKNLENDCLNSRFLYPLLRAVLKKNDLSLNYGGFNGLLTLRASVQRYIIRGLRLYKNISTVNSTIKLQINKKGYYSKDQKTISVTYYPSLHLAKKGLRFKPNVELIKVFLEKTRKKRAWCKTRQFLL